MEKKTKLEVETQRSERESNGHCERTRGDIRVGEMTPIVSNRRAIRPFDDCASPVYRITMIITSTENCRTRNVNVNAYITAGELLFHRKRNIYAAFTITRYYSPRARDEFSFGGE